MAKKTPSFFGMFRRNQHPDSDSFAECIEFLGNSDAGIRKDALEAILRNHIGKITDTDRFGEIMRNDDDMDIQILAMRVLGQIGTDDCINQIAYMVTSPDEYVRAKSISILRETGNIRAYYALKETYKTVRPEFQHMIRRALDKMREELQIDDQDAIVSGKLSQSVLKSVLPKIQEQEQRPTHGQTDQKTAKDLKEKPSTLMSFADEEESPSQSKLSYEILDDEDDIPLQSPSGSGPKRPSDGETPPPARPEEPPAQKDPQKALLTKTAVDEKPAEPQQEHHARHDMVSEMLACQLRNVSGEPADPEILKAYSAALLTGSEQAKNYLCSCASEGDSPASLQALQALISTGDPERFRGIFISKAKSKNPDIILRGIIPLMNSGDPETISAVFPLTEHGDEKIKKFAINYFINNTGPDVSEFIYQKIMNGNNEEKITGAALLARLDIKDTRKHLKKILQDPNTPNQVILSIFSRLSPSHSDVIIASLPALMQRDDEKIYLETARFLNDSDDLIAEEFLLRNIQTKDNKLRGKSILLLSKIKSKRGESYLPSMIVDLSDYTRLQTAKAICEYGKPEYYELIALAMQSEKHAGNKIECIRMATEIYGKNITPKLLGMLASESSEIKFAILEALGKIDHKEYRDAVLSTLKQCLKSTDLRLVYYALIAQIRLGDMDFGGNRQILLGMLWNIINDKRNPVKIRRDSLECLCAAAKDESYEMLIGILRSEPNESIVLTAMRCIVAYKNDTVTEILTEKASSQNCMISELASRLLREMGR